MKGELYGKNLYILLKIAMAQSCGRSTSIKGGVFFSNNLKGHDIRSRYSFEYMFGCRIHTATNTLYYL